MALLTGAPRALTAFTHTETRLIVIRKEGYERLVASAAAKLLERKSEPACGSGR